MQNGTSVTNYFPNLGLGLGGFFFFFFLRGKKKKIAQGDICKRAKERAIVSPP